jgi:hypothetical protein
LIIKSFIEIVYIRSFKQLFNWFFIKDIDA